MISSLLQGVPNKAFEQAFILRLHWVVQSGMHHQSIHADGPAANLESSCVASNSVSASIYYFAAMFSVCCDINLRLCLT